MIWLWISAPLFGKAQMSIFQNGSITHRIFQTKEEKNKVKILYLHGALHFLESRTSFIEKLENKGFDIVGLEHRDHGLSSARNKKTSFLLKKQDFDVYVQDVANFIDKHLKDENIIIMGNSFGGHVALRYIQKFGIKNVKGIILLAPFIDLPLSRCFVPNFMAIWWLHFLRFFWGEDAYIPGHKGRTPESHCEKYNKYPKHQKHLLNHKEKIMSQISIGWAIESIKSVEKLKQMHPISIPTLAFLAHNDKEVCSQKAEKFISNKLPPK